MVKTNNTNAIATNKTGLLINGVTEILGGIVLLLKGDWVFGDLMTTISGATMVRLYAVAILIIGIVSIQLSKIVNNIDQKVLNYIVLAFITFHFIIAMTLFGAYKAQGFAMIEAVVLHSTIGLIMGYCYFNSQKSGI